MVSAAIVLLKNQRDWNAVCFRVLIFLAVWNICVSDNLVLPVIVTTKKENVALGRFFSLIYSARKAYKPQIVFWKKTSGLDFGFLCKFSLHKKFYPAQIFSWNREHSVRPRCAKCVYHFLHFLSDAVHQIFFCQNDQLTCWLVLVINFLMTEVPASQIIC